jgi:hypothetical protein
MIAPILQRLADWRREARIQRLVREMARSHPKHSTNYQRALWNALRAEIIARSPQQVARMERRQGIA